MTLKKNFFVILFVTLSLAFAQTSKQKVLLNNVSDGLTEIKILSESDGEIIIQFSVGNFYLENIETEKGIFSKLTFEDGKSSLELGRPHLPVFRKIIELPYAANPNIEIISSTIQELNIAEINMASIYPLQHSIRKTPEEKPFEYDESLYKTDSYYPINIFDIKALGLARKHNLYQITTFPVQYNPMRAKLKVYTNMTFKINFNYDKSFYTQQEISKYYSQLFNKAVGSVSFNKELLKETKTLETAEEPGGFLIITHDNFYNTIQSFATHKESRGHDVTVVKKSDITDQTNDGIRNYIINAYNNWDPPVENVLLIGDVAYIPEFIGEYCWTASDYKYSLMEDDDWLPDIFIGRFSVENTTQLNNIINKEITYENGDWSTYDWTKKTVFMASNDQYSISEGSHNYVISNYLDPEGYTSEKLYAHTYSATTTQVINAFNDGRIYGVYSGHGTQTSWYDGPPLYLSHVLNLTNGYKLPLIFSFACLAGQFNYLTECFGETWLREANKASIGFWGSSNLTYWEEDDILERRLFSSIYDEIKTSFGGMTVEAKMKFIEYWSLDYFRAKYYLEAYNILGDPTLNYPYLYNYACSNKSINSTATGQNNGRRLVKDGSGNYHLVFTSGNEIYYRKNTGSWQNPIRLSDVIGENNYPSITIGNSNSILVVWQRKSATTTYDICFAMSTDNGSTWPTNYKYAISSSVNSSVDPLPVIAVNQSTYYKTVMYDSSSILKSKTSTSTYPPNQTSWVSYSVTGTTSGDLSPTIATGGNSFYNLLANQNTSTNKVYYRYQNSGGSWTSPVILSDIVPGPTAKHITPSITGVPSSGLVHVSWKRDPNNGSTTYQHRIIHRRKSTPSGTWPSDYFQLDYEGSQLPSISGLTSTKIDLLFTRLPSNSLYKSRFNGTSWSSPTYVADPVFYPSLSIGGTTSKYVYTSGSSSPYTINLSSQLSKELEIDPLDYYSRSIAWIDSSGAFLEVKLHPMFLKLKDGSKQRIDIIPISLDTFKLTLGNSFELLSSVPFQIPTDAEEIVFDYTVSAEGMDKVLNNKTENITPVFNLVNSDNQILANSNRSHILTSNKLQEVRQQFTIPVNGISNALELKAEIKLNGLIPKTETFASLGHIFDFTTLENKEGKGQLAINGTKSFKELTMRNYPNPFNPITSIQYQIPQEAIVILKVYDVLGREITTLVSEEKSAGVYNVSFDASQYPSGVYFYRIESGGKFLSRKMLLIK